MSNQAAVRANLAATFLFQIALGQFNGSTAVGRQLTTLASEHMTRVLMELGGHAPVIVREDTDIEKAPSAARSANTATPVRFARRPRGSSCLKAPTSPSLTVSFNGPKQRQGRGQDRARSPMTAFMS